MKRAYHGQLCTTIVDPARRYIQCGQYRYIIDQPTIPHNSPTGITYRESTKKQGERPRKRGGAHSRMSRQVAKRLRNCGQHIPNPTDIWPSLGRTMVSPTYPCTHTSLDVSLIRCLLASIDKISTGAISGCDSGPVQVGLSFAPNASKGIGRQLCCT